MRRAPFEKIKKLLGLPFGFSVLQNTHSAHLFPSLRCAQARPVGQIGSRRAGWPGQRCPLRAATRRCC